MPRLLRDVLCVIETFHKYARENGEEATLTGRELKRLIQGEFGSVLQPRVIHAVERNLTLLDIDSDGTIGFDEFVLAIFNLLDLCYLDIQSLLNSEPGQVSEPEEKPDDVDLQATGRTGQWTEGPPPAQDAVVLPSGTASSAQLSAEERGYNRVDPQGDIKTHKLPGEASGHSDPENQPLGGAEQSQEVTQDVPAIGDKGAQIETNKPKAGSEQTGSLTKGDGQDEEAPRKGDEPAQEQSAAETRDQFGEQDGNLGTQSSPSEETTQRPPDKQEVVAERGVLEISNTQEQPPPSSVRADMPARAAAWKPLQTQKSPDPEDEGRTAKTREPGKDADRTLPETKNPAEPEDDGRTSETHESPAQEKEHETKDRSMQGDSRNVSETPDVQTEQKDGGGPEAHGTEGQEESERKTQLPALEDKAQGGKSQELQEPSKERDAEEGPKTQELSAKGGDQNHAETGTIAAGDVAGQAEEGAAEAPVGSSNAPAAEGTPGARERQWRMAPGENKRVPKTHDKSVKEEDGHHGGPPEPRVTQSDKGSPETCNCLTPEDGDNSSETSNLPVQGDSQHQGDPLGESMQGSHSKNPDAQKQVALGEATRTQEAVVPTVAGGQDEPPMEDPDGEAPKSRGSGTRGPGPAVEPTAHPEAQESTVRGENRKSPETETPGAVSADFTDQLLLMQLPRKEDSKTELKIQRPGTKEEEDGAPKAQEAPVKSLDEDNPASPKTHVETEDPATLEEEDESPQGLAGEGDDQQNPAKGGPSSSVPPSALQERTQTDQEPRCAESGTFPSSLLYEYLQETLRQRTDRTAGQRQTQGQTARASSPELHKDQLATDLSGRPVSFDDC
ncbi:trichohyalin-like protein 1 [Hipposideros larvatus]